MTVKDGGREGNVDGQASVLLAAPSSGSFGFIELAEKILNLAPPFVDVGVEFWWEAEVKILEPFSARFSANKEGKRNMICYMVGIFARFYRQRPSLSH